MRLALVLALLTSGCNGILGIDPAVLRKDGGVDVSRDGACACGPNTISCTPDCKPTCAPGFAHCTTNDADGCETSIGGSDATNCGACGHGCLGGACAEGACLPVTLADTEDKPNGIAVDSGSTGNVYWANISFAQAPNKLQMIRRVEKNKPGMAIDLYPAPNTAQGMAPFVAGLTVAGSNVYWTTFACQNSYKTNVYFGPKNGGVPTAVTDNGQGWVSMTGIAADSKAVYWVGTGCGGAEPRNIVKAPIGSANATTLLYDVNNPAPQSLGIAVEDGDTGSIYWSNGNSGLRKISKDGKSNVQLDNQSTLVAINTKSVFYSYKNTLYMIGKDGKCATSTCPVVLADIGVGEIVSGIVADDAYVYFNAATYGQTPAGHTYAVKADGTSPAPIFLASKEQLPAAIAIDAVAVYWLDQFAGKILKLAKLP